MRVANKIWVVCRTDSPILKTQIHFLVFTFWKYFMKTFLKNGTEWALNSWSFSQKKKSRVIRESSWCDSKKLLSEWVHISLTPFLLQLPFFSLFILRTFNSKFPPLQIISFTLLHLHKPEHSEPKHPFESTSHELHSYTGTLFKVCGFPQGNQEILGINSQLWFWNFSLFGYCMIISIIS